MGIFDKIKEASVMEGGVYVLPGIYRVQLQACKQRKTRKGIDMTAVEMRVLESTNPERPPGSDMSWVVTFDKDAALGNVKQFIAGVMGIKYEEVDPAGTELVFSEQNPLKGHFARISAFNVKTKAGKDFTRLKWINDAEGAEGALKAHQAQSSEPTASDEAQAQAAG